ncbi:Putative carbohydrate-binding WSC [Septoria linicola]|uniref:Carbohydrate-binding WSC n=1 Tax=Septoria linicola TaxID=215465 RepID=A0A9Q9APS4_9PEZI|nr:putative carbohydrate-binding WSC [Septoria linicola]USW53467.1 Putative carbohydrate-binding WSC [Septoria linicola]
MAAQPVYQGCYSSQGTLRNRGAYAFESTGHCYQTCMASASPVLATTNGNECLCGDEVPAASKKVDDSTCNLSCAGYAMEKCGGKGYFSVYTMGEENGGSCQ